MSQSPPRLPPDVLAEVMGRVPVKQSRQLAKMTHQGSPDYTRLLKQRGYTDEFLVELLDAVELIEPGMLEILKVFYDFRKKHKKDKQLLTEDIMSYRNQLDHIVKPEVYNRLYFIKLYYKYKVYSLFNLDWDKYDSTHIHIRNNKDNLDGLNKLLEDNKSLRQDIYDYKEAFEEEDLGYYYFGTAFVETFKSLLNEEERHYDQSIELVEAAIRDYHARRAAEAEAKKQRTATKRLITRVNNAADERDRKEKEAAKRLLARANKAFAAAEKTRTKQITPSVDASPSIAPAVADAPESSRAARARARSERRNP